MRSKILFTLTLAVSVASPASPRADITDEMTSFVRSYLPLLLGNIRLIASSGSLNYEELIGNLGLATLPGYEAENSQASVTLQKRDTAEEMAQMESLVGSLYQGVSEFAKYSNLDFVANMFASVQPILAAVS